VRRAAAALAIIVASCGGEVPRPITIAETPKKKEPALSANEVRAEIHRVLVLSRPERLATWRKWTEHDDARFAVEGAVQLARIREGASLIVALIARTDDHSALGHLAAALLEFPRSDLATPMLRQKLAAATLVDRAQLAVALVHVGDGSSLSAIIAAHRSDDLAIAQTLDRAPALDVRQLSTLAPHASFRALASDESARVRKLVAQVLSAAPDAEDLDVLASLVVDKDLDVTLAAAAGIASTPTNATANLMLTKRLGDLESSDNEAMRVRGIDAIERGGGGAALLRALDAVPATTSDEESRARFIIERIRELRDPSAASTYAQYLKNESNPPHYRAQIALALADIGEAAALPYLAARMTAQGIGFHCGADKSPKCLSNNLGWKRQPPPDADPVTFREQASSARAIGDLALLHPGLRAPFLTVASAPIAKFDGWFPAPWLVTRRALAHLGDPNSAAWAKKTVQAFKLPPQTMVSLEPQTIFAVNAFISASRYVGRTGDPTMIDALAGHLERPKTKGGSSIGLSMMEMELAQNPGFREVAIYAAEAAADGLAEWGPGAAPATDRLLAVVRDPGHAMFARLQAGRALGRIASDAQLLTWLEDARAWKDPDARISIMMAARPRSNAELAATAIEFIVKTDDPAQLGAIAWAARVVGAGDLAALAPQLLAMLEDPATRPYAALAIILGGDDELVTRGMLTFEARARIEGTREKDLSILRALFVDSFAFREVVAADVPRLVRTARNVDVMTRLGAITDVDEKGRSEHAWAATAFSEALARLELAITVPGGLDRTLLLDAVRRSGDVRALRYLGEKGSLLALAKSSEPARRALRELDAAPPIAEADAKSDPYFSKPKK
jgi:hypothetical protein